MMKRPLVELCAAAILATVSAWATGASATDRQATNVDLVSAQNAAEVVASTTAKLRADLAAMAAGASNGVPQHDTRLQGLVERHVGPHVDFDRIANWVIGKPWAVASQTQRRRLLTELRKMMFRTYSQALGSLAEANIVYGKAKVSRSGKNTVIPTRVTAAAGSQMTMKYYLYKRNDAWRLYDISVSGVRMLPTYKATFKDRMRRSGMDGLIDHLVAINTTHGS